MSTEVLHITPTAITVDKAVREMASIGRLLAAAIAGKEGEATVVVSYEALGQAHDPVIEVLDRDKDNITIKVTTTKRGS